MVIGSQAMDNNSHLGCDFIALNLGICLIVLFLYIVAVIIIPYVRGYVLRFLSINF